ncbi:MAG TPA: hypothetical protein DD381_02290 [Lentisphaeria bacterium]|nr:MAG: hypothetical protein A2X47_08745 [Lentisphaerae bacterium GWF2_38_69]HBM15166.1 hypothetical protein [Lentisphaeria bacterium]
MIVKTSKIFTLIELIASLLIFVIILGIVLMFFNSAKNIWSISESKRQAFEDGRIALELISRDLQSVYYTADTAPFWFKSKTSTNQWYDSQAINFISIIDIKDASESYSGLYEVKYFLWYPENSVISDSDGWLMRSITGEGSEKWDFNDYPLSVGLTGSGKAFTANNDSSEPANKIIPYVTKIEFNCFQRTGAIISSSQDSIQELPYSIEIRIFILPHSEWLKWLSIGGNPKEAIDGSETLSNSAAANFREKNEIMFSKTVLLSERGQN